MKILGLRVVVEVRVVAGPVDVVEVVDQVLHREVRGERLDVEVVGEFGVERGVVGVVDEVEELDQGREVFVVLARLLIEHLVVGLRVVAAIAVVAGAFGLVERTIVCEVVVHPNVVGVFDRQPKFRLTPIDAEGDGDGVLRGQAGEFQQIKGDGLIE